MIDRNTHLTISVRTYTHYTECELWCQANIGEWNIDWWRDFPDIAAAVIIQGPHGDCYWFHNEQSALMFRLKFR